MRSEIMYVELKGTSGVTGDARIGLVTFSKTGKTMYFDGRTLEPARDGGGKINHVDADTGEEFWVSGCKKAGGDTLYPGTIKIDADVREEYWRDIRHEPGRATETTIRSLGKHNKHSQ